MTISAAGPDQHAADRQALDLEREDLGRDVLGLVGGGGELDAARLAATADEHLGLDDHLAGGVARIGEEPDGGGARLGGGAGDLPGGDGEPLGDEQRLRVGFLDLHATGETSGRADLGGARS